MVVLTADQSKSLNDAVVNLVKNDVDKAREFLMLAGHDETSADKMIEDIKTSIMVNAAQERLSDFRKEVESKVLEVIDVLPSVDDAIEVVEVSLKYSNSEKPDTPGEIVGWYVTSAKTRVKGEKRASSGSTGRKSTGNGNGRRGRVPCPEGISSWNAHFVATYPDEAAKKGETSFSAPRELERLNDPTYLKAKSEAGV